MFKNACKNYLKKYMKLRQNVNLKIRVRVVYFLRRIEFLVVRYLGEDITNK